MTRYLSRKQFLAYAATMGAAVALSPLTGCSANPSNGATTNANTAADAVTPAITTGEVGVIEDTSFNGVLIDMSQSDFEALGFRFGDALDIQLSNGKTYEDVPFYNDYYARTGDPVVVSYDGAGYPKFTRAQKGIWDECDITENDTIVVTLREAGKYFTVQEACNVTYSNDRNDFTSDTAFANFRACTGGKLRKDLVYRSASPINDCYNRASYAHDLVAAAGIQYSLDLSDDEGSFASYAIENVESCPYYIDLHDAGKVETLKLNAAFSGDAFKTSLSAALARMCDQPSPYLIHCVEGKDRTGFACMLIEALAEASVDELVDDYMVTYDNYYHISKTSDADHYEAIKKVKCYDSLMIIADVNDEKDVTAAALHTGAENYLREGGLTDAQIAQIESVLTR